MKANAASYTEFTVLSVSKLLEPAEALLLGTAHLLLRRRP
jgi:hypothetical protein